MTTKKDSQNRSWMLTIPADSLDEAELVKKLGNYTYIGQMEKGADSGYLHWQIYIEHKTPIRFSTLKKKFPKAHLEVRHNTKKACYDYVTKSKTAIQGTRVENGKIEIEETESAKVTVEMAVDLMKRGSRYKDIIVEYPSLWRSMAYLKEVQGYLDENEYSTKKRDMKVYYIHGAPGTGKTHSVYEEHGFDQVYKVSNYINPYDQYNGQSVLLLDEFYDSIQFDALLNVIDVWPFQMRARYGDKWAAYDTVYIVSNRPLKDQFITEFYYEPERARSFYRRITANYEMVGRDRVLDNSWLDQQVPPENRL